DHPGRSDRTTSFRVPRAGPASGAAQRVARGETVCLPRANVLRCVGPTQVARITLVSSGETTDARKAAALVPSSDPDLLLQCPQIAEAGGGHIATACSRLATKSYASMPAPLRLPARRDEPVSSA